MTLTSYERIRYRGEEPEGMGSASPFSNGLNALITRPYATLVRALTLRGEWRELELEEHSRVGRVPDSSMMLNIAVRAAVDRMTELESFSWDLSTKMLETVYLGLSQLPHLKDLTIRFPSSRHPRPTIVIPPMPHLRRLKVTDIDPLCYPDDISTLLWKCKKLRDLYMHWSPRMRNDQEPSVMLHDYFRKCVAAREPLAIKKLALQNMYAFHSEEFNHAFDPTTFEEFTMLNDFGSDEPSLTFVDRSWPVMPPHERLRIKSIRQDSLSKRNAEFLDNFTGLEKFYLVNGMRDGNDVLNFPRSRHTSASSSHSRSHSREQSATTNPNSPVSKSPSTSNALNLHLQELHLNVLITNHSATLRHLLLPARWALSPNTVYRLVHASPQLEQLGLAADINSLDVLGILVPFLRKLVALRVLIPTGPGIRPDIQSQATGSTNGSSGSASGSGSSMPQSLAEIVEQDDDFLTNKLATSLADRAVHKNLKVVGIGRKAWQLLDFYRASPEELSAATAEKNNPQVHSDSCAPSNGSSNSPTTNGNGSSSNGISRTSSQTTYSNPNTNPNKDSPKSRSQNNAFSILGKRGRDENNPPPSPSPNGPRHPQTQSQSAATPGESPQQFPQVVDPDCGPWHVSPDAHLWRRRVKPVGWDVLKHWEIWELDKQEF